MARELDSLIYWPLREDVQRYYLKCFKRYENIIGIIDCTEGLLKKRSIAKLSFKLIPVTNQETLGKS